MRVNRYRLVSLQVERLSFSYKPGVELISNLSFSLPRGEVALLWGPSGCGKSTLMKLLLGALPPRGGEILWVSDKGSSFHPSPQLTRAHIGYQPQELLIPRYMSVKEVIEQLLSLRGERITANELKLIEELGLSPEALTSELSVGELSRVALARAIAGSPDFVLLDEPTAHLDDGSKVTVLRALDIALDDGTGLVIATHDPHLKGWASSRSALIVNFTSA